MQISKNVLIIKNFIPLRNVIGGLPIYSPADPWTQKPVIWRKFIQNSVITYTNIHVWSTEAKFLSAIYFIACNYRSLNQAAKFPHKVECMSIYE
jgi:hypothetical protein